MKSSHIAIGIFALTIPLAVWYSATAAQCPVPLSYRLGEIDDSFLLTPEQARDHIEVAVQTWEGQMNRDLFVYDEAADFTINFVFDERQESVRLEEEEREALDIQQEQKDEVVAQIESLQTQYDSLARSYEADISSYEARLNAHNREVSNYNDRGGAPAEEFERLEEERTALAAQSDELSDTARILNTLGREINDLSERGVNLVDDYNKEVDRYNAEFGFEREFTQGDYQGDKINIYSFSSENELERVLAHELGHALGIGHVDDDSALMYYLMGEPDSALTLSTADETAYLNVCGTHETAGQRIRHFIRSSLTVF